MSYERDKIIGLLYRIFQAEGYTWHGQPDPPTYEKIEEVISNLENEIIEERRSPIETGRIRIEYDKDSQSFDYYLNLGMA